MDPAVGRAEVVERSVVPAASPPGSPRRKRAVRRALAGIVALAAGAIAGVLWWELLRDRQPPIEGRIDDRWLPSERLCVREVEAPCRPVDAVERLLRQDALVIRGAEQTHGGNQGVIALALEAPGGARLKAKWRSLESASLFNTPAKELAAYHVQRLLLDPRDYVVPPVASHCFALDEYHDAVLESAAPLEGTDCVLGFLSYWLIEGITMPEARREGVWPMPPDGADDDDPQLFDARRFEEDPVYRRNLAILNLITHVVNNRDAHAGQFVLYDEPWHAFLVDNSLTFRAVPNPYTMFMQDLSRMHVPAIPADVAARLESLAPADLEALRVIDEYVIDDGRLRRTSPGAPLPGDAFLRRSGARLQIGLPEADVRETWERIEGVRRALREGRLRTF